MTIKTFRIRVSTTAGTDIIDITPEIERIAAQAGNGADPMRMTGVGATAMDTPICVPRCWAHRLPSLLADGKLLLGTWQQVVVCDFDNRPRTRDSIVQLHLPS